MALTDTLRQPPGLELPGTLRARGWGQGARDRVDSRELPVRVRSDEPFEAQVHQAAAAERLLEQNGEGITWWLRMPAAGRDNTEVVWDPRREKLSVGVWSRPVPQAEAAEGGVTRTGGSARTTASERRMTWPRGERPGRLLWHTSTWQPGVDAARATARIAGGWLRVHLPRAKSA